MDFALLRLGREGLAEREQVPVAAGPQGEGLAAELLPGLLVRLGRLLVVPVGLQTRCPVRTDETQSNNAHVSGTHGAQNWNSVKEQLWLDDLTSRNNETPIIHPRETLQEHGNPKQQTLQMWTNIWKRVGLNAR